MNAIMDLTARAISFITTVQTTLLKGAIALEKEDAKLSILNIPPSDFETKLKEFIRSEQDIISGENKKSEEDNFTIRATELVWISTNTTNKSKAVEYTTALSAALVKWIWDNKEHGIFKMLEPFGRYPTPFDWREVISTILYRYPDERLHLARALQYLPMQIILALGGGSCDAKSQRIFQMWEISDDDKRELLNEDEIEVLDKFTSLEEKSETDAETLLKNDDILFKYLIKSNCPISFEHVFLSELKEIKNNRARRISEQNITASDQLIHLQPQDDATNNDPFDKGKQMNLYALAFSGGGIRSATFNLGILQGLAKKNLIGKFDYLSTVSGGGYIGSWLAAWIKRDGSVVKVTNRLNPDKSPDPLGEELKPIRWLRMFSNYFAPNASIMSVDSWTIGITWLRNTLLNQVIIFLLLLSLLFTGNLLYEIWSKDIRWRADASSLQLLAWSSLLLIPVSLFAGLGMHAYQSKSFRWLRVRREWTNIISLLILLIAFIAAYLLSAWVFSRDDLNGSSISLLPYPDTAAKIKELMPAAFVTFIALSIVAVLGNYVECIKGGGNSWFFAWFTLVATALIAAAAGLLCLVFVWKLLETIETAENSFVSAHKEMLQFIVGVPLMLEVFSVTVVARMALLGKYFPDERREWWGRIGAFVHRLSFLWLLVSASALLGKDFIGFIFTKWWTGLAATGGWIALVGSTVKAAFSSKTTGKENTNGYLSVFLNFLGLSGPYLFALGMLVFLPGLIQPLLNAEGHFFGHAFPGIHIIEEVKIICIIILFAAISYLLARQVGVNEFSMHHFYRNRLVRAFLGATRRSTDRQITSNPFTGFDMSDDEKLYKMRNEFGYYGPYPVLNTALNASQVIELDRQDRKAESFIFSPLFCGFDFSVEKASADVKMKSYDYAFRETKNYAYENGGPNIGTAMAISGAAINPNQGYHSSAATAFLLTVFNVQMGRWIGNPRKSTWQCSDPKFGLGYIINNLMGKTNTRNDFIALSDGGHFDNMGLYEMIRRKCTNIILCDAEQDDKFTCEGFANAIRRCRIDFGAEINIDITPITSRSDGRFSKAHYALGYIMYAGDKKPSGKLLYIKSSITGDEPVDVYEYAVKNATFPHQTTADQFFDEEQFESYRKLGLYIADKAFADPDVIGNLWPKKVSEIVK